MSVYRVAVKCGDSYGKEKRGYLASSRIRGHWLAKYWEEADDYFYPYEFKQSSEDFFQLENQMKILNDYEVVIFNKTYEWRLAKLLRQNNQKVIVDMCDPDHLLTHSSQQRVNDCLSTLKYASAVVVNGEVMKQSVRKVYRGKIATMCDRMDLEAYYPRKVTYNEVMKRIVWYGYSENLRVLEPYLKDILNLGLEITVISDKFFDNLMLAGCKVNPKEKITFKVWHPDSINEQIISHDAVFTGKDLDPYLSQFKSNNRKMTAHALKMPVAEDIVELKALFPVSARMKNAFQGYNLCRQLYDVRHSVYQYDQLIKKLLRKK